MLNFPLAQVLAHLYPTAENGTDYTLLDRSDGNGAVIETWNTEKLGPQPTVSELQAKAQEAIANKEAREAQFLADAQTLRDLKNKARSAWTAGDVRAYAQADLGTRNLRELRFRG
jgi:hypothetical protein